MSCSLAKEIMKRTQEDINQRPYLLSLGIRDISALCTLPRNSFKTITAKCDSYDDMRTCHICNHYCIFTAVACECDQSRVACIRHHHMLCKCPNTKKFMLTWSTTPELVGIKLKAEKLASLSD